MSRGTYVSTTIDRNYDNKHPLRVELERYRKEKFSEQVFRRIMRVWEHQMNNNWITSGTSMLDDWLKMTNEGLNFITRVSKDIDLKREYYYENHI